MFLHDTTHGRPLSLEFSEGSDGSTNRKTKIKITRLPDEADSCRTGPLTQVQVDGLATCAKQNKFFLNFY
jgi:hypothetical protein